MGFELHATQSTSFQKAELMGLSHYSARVLTGCDTEAELRQPSCLPDLGSIPFTLNRRAALNSIHLIGSISLKGDRRLEWSEDWNYQFLFAIIVMRRWPFKTGRISFSPQTVKTRRSLGDQPIPLSSSLVKLSQSPEKPSPKIAPPLGLLFSGSWTFLFTALFMAPPERLQSPTTHSTTI